MKPIEMQELRQLADELQAEGIRMNAWRAKAIPVDLQEFYRGQAEAYEFAVDSLRGLIKTFKVETK